VYSTEPEKNGYVMIGSACTLFYYGTDETTIDCLIQRLNLCRDPSHFRCFDTAAEKLNELWMGKPV